MSNVIKFYPLATEAKPDTMLNQAIGEYESVLIMGYTSDGYLQVGGSANLDKEKLLWMMEAFKLNLLQGDSND